MYPNLQGIGTKWAALFFVAYRFLMTDVLSAIIESLMLDAYERKQESSRAKEAESVLASGIAARMEGAAGAAGRAGASSGGDDGAVVAPTRKFLLRARAEVLDEIEAIETGANSAWSAGAEALDVGIKAGGISAQDLELVKTSLKKLEEELRVKAVPKA
jgi:hypothetical protein